MQPPLPGIGSTEILRVLLSGASGLVGSALGQSLRESGHVVFRLVRRASRAADEIEWDPAADRVGWPKDARFDAVINLSGENIAGGRWTDARKQRILQSRIQSTRTLVKGLAGLSQPPSVLVNGSATGIYGNRGDEMLTEESGPSEGFLADVCQRWEHEARQAEKIGVRVGLIRTGMVLSVQGGALALMLPIFRLGLGGRLGRGRQWISWVELDDLVAIVRLALSDPRFSGPVNAVSPHPVRNVEFTRALGRAVGRPTVLPAPAWALRLVFGEMADATLLASARVTPARLREFGFEFRHAEIDGALRHSLARKQR